MIRPFGPDEAWFVIFAVRWTLLLSAVAFAGGAVGGLLVALARVAKVAPLRYGALGFIRLFQGTPLLMQLFLVYFGLSILGYGINPWVAAALLALTINVGAYATEIIRAGIESIRRGQVEAGTALGLSRAQIFRYIIMKPALRTIYPALTSQFIYLMLTSSVVSVISASDLAAAGNDINARTFASFEVYLVITAIYLVLSFGFSALFAAIGRASFAYPLAR